MKSDLGAKGMQVGGDHTYFGGWESGKWMEEVAFIIE